jgi:hypothetical protein
MRSDIMTVMSCAMQHDACNIISFATGQSLSTVNENDHFLVAVTVDAKEGHTHTPSYLNLVRQFRFKPSLLSDLVSLSIVAPLRASARTVTPICEQWDNGSRQLPYL